MNNLIKETLILDYNSLVIQDLINSRQWKELNDVEKVKSIYNFNVVPLIRPLNSVL